MKKTLFIMVGLLYLGITGCNETPTEVQPTNSDDNSETLSKTTANTCTAYVDASGQNVIIEANLNLVSMPGSSEFDCDGSNYPYLHVHIKRHNYINSLTLQDLNNGYSSCIQNTFLNMDDLWIEGRIGSLSGTSGDEQLNANKTINLKYVIPITAATNQGSFSNSASNPGQFSASDLITSLYNKYLETSTIKPTGHRGFVRGKMYTIEFYPWWNGPRGITGNTFTSCSVIVPLNFNVSISGPSSLVKPQNATMTASVSGSTDGTQQYIWEASTRNIGSGTWGAWSIVKNITSSAMTDTKTFTMGNFDIRFRVTVSSGGTTAVSPIHTVYYGTGEEQ